MSDNYVSEILMLDCWCIQWRKMCTIYSIVCICLSKEFKAINRKETNVSWWHDIITFIALFKKRMEQERGYYVPGGKRFLSQMSWKDWFDFRVSLSANVADSWLSGVGCRVLVVGFWVSGVGCRLPGVGCRRDSDVGCQLSVVRCWLMMLCVGCRSHFPSSALLIQGVWQPVLIWRGGVRGRGEGAGSGSGSLLPRRRRGLRSSGLRFQSLKGQ